VSDLTQIYRGWIIKPFNQGKRVGIIRKQHGRTIVDHSVSDNARDAIDYIKELIDDQLED